MSATKRRTTPQRQHPFIMKSTLVQPPRWFIVTKYDVKSGIDVTPSSGDGQRHKYMIAREKFDVTDQMHAILQRECQPQKADWPPRSMRQTIPEHRQREITSAAREYVDAQLRTMAKHGAAPSLTSEQYEALVQKCAKPAFEVEKWRHRNDKKGTKK